MKRIAFIYSCMFIIMFFVGCIPRCNNDYKVYEKKYTSYNEAQKEYTVKYMQVSGIGNKKLEKKINKALRLSVTEWLNEHCEWMERSKISIECQTSKYLSICYMIEWRNPDKDIYVTPCTRIGVTIDMRTGKRLFLDDFIKDMDDLKQKLMSYDYGNEISPPINSDEADNIIYSTLLSEKEYLEERYKTDTHVYNEIISVIGEKPSFYITDNRLIITRDKYEPDDVYIDLQ